MFSSILRGDHQLISCEPSRDTYLACALLLRGDVQVSDVQHNMSKLRSKMRFIHWNSDGFKVGLCSMPSSSGAPYSMLCLANNCCVRGTFKRLQDRFSKLYRARAHLHHYTEHMEKEQESGLERSQLKYGHGGISRRSPNVCLVCGLCFDLKIIIYINYYLHLFFFLEKKATPPPITLQH